MRPTHLVANLVLAALLVWLSVGLLQALRRGQYALRGGKHIVHRRRQPLQFWFGILIGGAFLAAGFGALAQVIGQALAPP